MESWKLVNKSHDRLSVLAAAGRAWDCRGSHPPRFKGFVIFPMLLLFVLEQSQILLVSPEVCYNSFAV